jgi:transcriptional regulator of acetoin/glycerol metabolism
VRVIAATHQVLEERVARGLFREDLFHRLNVIRMELPPLGRLPRYLWRTQGAVAALGSGASGVFG